MKAKTAMDIGMKIAEDHTRVALDIFRVKPEATTTEALRGTQVWLGAQIMQALMAALRPADCTECNCNDPPSGCTRAVRVE